MFQKERLEALASLLAHELTHVLKKPTVDEEVAAYTMEAIAWQRLKKDDIKETELTKILDFVLDLYNKNAIRNYVENSKFYGKQLK